MYFFFPLSFVRFFPMPAAFYCQKCTHQNFADNRIVNRLTHDDDNMYKKRKKKKKNTVNNETKLYQYNSSTRTTRTITAFLTPDFFSVSFSRRRVS